MPPKKPAEGPTPQSEGTSPREIQPRHLGAWVEVSLAGLAGCLTAIAVMATLYLIGAVFGGGLGAVGPAEVIALLVSAMIPFWALRKLYDKRAYGVVLLGCAVLVTAFLAVSAYESESDVSLPIEVLILTAASGCYYTLAAATLIRLSNWVQLSVVGVCVIALILASPTLNARGRAFGHEHFQKQTNDSVLNLPYTVFGPSSPEFKLQQAFSEYQVTGPSQEVDLDYKGPAFEFIIENLQLPKNYDPPMNCVTRSALVSNYEPDALPCKQATTDPRLANVYIPVYANAGENLYFIKHDGTLVIVHSREPFTVSAMYSLVSTLTEVTAHQMHASPKGISYGTGGETLPGDTDYSAIHGLVQDSPTPQPASSPAPPRLKVCSATLAENDAKLSGTSVVTGIDLLHGKLSFQLNAQNTVLATGPFGTQVFDKSCGQLTLNSLKVGDQVVLGYSPSLRTVDAIQKLSN